MRSNINQPTPGSPTTFEGAPASYGSALDQLRRAICSCLLWEDTFYEGGVAIADRIKQLVEQCCDEGNGPVVALLAVEARHQMKLRHAPLWLLACLAGYQKGKYGPSKLVYASVIDRADEMGELLALYRKDEPKRPIPAQMKLGLSLALTKFDEYQLAKYDRNKDSYHLKDILRLVHPKPDGETQAALWKRVIEGTMATPNTWETRLSAGEDKKTVFTELLEEGKLGYLALLRNLRNMKEAGVTPGLIESAILAGKGANKVLPFRFLAAMEHAPEHAQVLDTAMQMTIQNTPVIPGRTAVCVDISGSMGAAVSAKSTMARWKVAASLAALINPGPGGSCRLFVFATGAKEVPWFKGLAGIQSVESQMSRMGYGTDIAAAVNLANKANCDRVIVISDMQSATPIGAPGGKGYLINVAPYQPTINYQGQWTHIDGWSEHTLRYIAEKEALGV